MTKREKQLIEYTNDQNIDALRKRIEFINQEITTLDNERFYLMARLFNAQNKQILEEDNDANS
jgi:hypothetical protein